MMRWTLLPGVAALLLSWPLMTWLGGTRHPLPVAVYACSAVTGLVLLVLSVVLMVREGRR